MKHRLIAMSLAAALLAACGDEPRGPLEVQGKTMRMSALKSLISTTPSTPITVEFSGREKGQITNLVTGEVKAFTYTLNDTQLVLQVSDKPGQAAETVAFAFDDYQQAYHGEELRITEVSEKDKKTMEANVKTLREIAAKEMTAKAEEESKAQALAAKLSPTGAPKEPSAYTAVPTLGDDAQKWSMWLYAAHQHAVQKIEEEELLRLFSAKWNSTQDSFDRQAMRAGELAGIQQRLEQLRAIEYIHIPWNEAQNALTFDIVASDSGAYDFEKKAFRLSGALCDKENTLRDHAGASFHFAQEQAFCLLPVSDEALARQIENARTTSPGVQLRAQGYFKVTSTEQGSVTLVPIGLEIAAHKGRKYQEEAGELLTTISHWPY